MLRFCEAFYAGFHLDESIDLPETARVGACVVGDYRPMEKFKPIWPREAEGESTSKPNTYALTRAASAESVYSLSESPP